MKLKTENVELLEKMSAGQQNRRNEQLRALEEDLAIRLTQIDQCKADIAELVAKNELLESDNIKLLEKVKKYKKEAKREARVNSETVNSQVRETEQRNQEMVARIQELEAVVVELNCKRMTNIDSDNRMKKNPSSRILEPELRKEKTSSRVIGIKNQRQEIEETHKVIDTMSAEEAR